MVKQKRMETGETEQSEWISNKFEHKELKAEDSYAPEVCKKT